MLGFLHVVGVSLDFRAFPLISVKSYKFQLSSLKEKPSSKTNEVILLYFADATIHFLEYVFCSF